MPSRGSDGAAGADFDVDDSGGCHPDDASQSNRLAGRKAHNTNISPPVDGVESPLEASIQDSV